MNLITNNRYVLRKQKETQNKDFFDSISDFFIHAILSTYQEHILNDNSIFLNCHILVLI